MKKRYPHIMEEIARHQWAMTGPGFDAILRAVESGLGSEDEPIFHGAPDRIAAEAGEPDPGEYHHGSKIDNIGIIRIEGPITPRASWLTQASSIASSEAIGRDLAKMEADTSIERIALVFDTPGGAVTGTSDLAAQIRATSKPVVSYVFGVAASAGYWLASAADEIVSADTGIVGSIGTVLTILNDKNEKIVKIISSQSPLKHADPEGEEGQASYQKIVDEISDVFINTVAANRGTTPENVIKEFGQGGELAASAALKKGMIDRISTFADFMTDLREADPSRWQNTNNGSMALDSEPEIGGNGFSDKQTLRADERPKTMSDETKTLKELLAGNPSAFSEHENKLSEARAEAQAGLRTDLALAAKVCASENYPKSVRGIAAEVIEGKRTQAALDAVMATAEMLAEQTKSKDATDKNKDLPDTPPGDKDPVSADGVIANMTDLEAALPKKVQR